MKWLLFDYGEVLCHAQPEADRARLAGACDAEPGRFWEAYWEHRLEFDRGALTPQAYWSQVLDRPASEAEVERLVALDVASWTHPNDDALAVAREHAARGHRLALLSNAPVCVADAIDALPWIQVVEARFYSGRLGLVKPGAEIYLRVADELGAPPGDFVFVDDRLVNVEGAESAGMTAVHFRDAASLRDDLKAVLTAGADGGK